MKFIVFLVALAMVFAQVFGSAASSATTVTSATTATAVVSTVTSKASTATGSAKPTTTGDSDEENAGAAVSPALVNVAAIAAAMAFYAAW